MPKWGGQFRTEAARLSSSYEEPVGVVAREASDCDGRLVVGEAVAWLVGEGW